MKKLTKRETEIIEHINAIIDVIEPNTINYKHTTNKIVAQEQISVLQDVSNFIRGIEVEEVVDELVQETKEKNVGWISSGTELR
jgi:hypothetical protein